MKTIWKYTLEKAHGVHKVFAIPEGGNPVRVGMQGIDLCIWVCVLPDAPKENRLFYFTGTGFPVDLKDTYVGSASEGPYEWHVWEVS